VRVAVIADTHSRRLPEECLRRLREADLVLHAGDHASVAALEELRALGPPVHAVCGNIDEPALQAALPAELELDLGGVRVGMTHDAGPRVGREARLTARFPGCAAVVYGHTHAPQVERVGGVWILNPGSPTERRRAPERTMLDVSLSAGRLVPELVSLPT
jgi:putative phosphoesterase